jgi:saccharopine dehydrogenase-like NADP-dependent oxidoreductase
MTTRKDAVMEYVVLGAGGVGRSLIADVLKTQAVARVTAIDNFDASLEAVAKLAPAERLKTLKLDVADIAAVVQAIGHADVVVNATDGSRSIEILKACIEAKKPYIDVHGTLLVNERLALSDAAKAAGITAVIGMGCSPGITNMLGAYGVRNAAGDISVEVEYITQRAMNPSMGLLDTVLRQFRDHVRSYEYVDGEYTLHPPFAGALRTRFPGIDGEVELVLTPHSEPQTLPRFVPGIKRVSVRGAYQPEIMDLVKTLSKFGLLKAETQVAVQGAPTDFQPVLRTALMGDGSLKPGGVETVYCLRVRVIAEQPGKRRVVETTVGHPKGWDPLPQARMTAIPTAFTAQLVASGGFRHPGVCGPEMFSDADVEACLAYLRERGLWTLTETRETVVAGPFDGAVPA